MASDANAAFVDEFRRRRAQRRLPFRDLGARTHHGEAYIQELGSGAKPPNLAIARRLDEPFTVAAGLPPFIECRSLDRSRWQSDLRRFSRRADRSAGLTRMQGGRHP